MPPFYIRKSILSSIYLGQPVPGVYIFRNDKTNVITGHSGNVDNRLCCYDKNFINKNLYNGKGYIYTHIELYEVQSKFLANALEMIIHNYFSPVIRNKNSNVFHPIDLEKEYNDYGGEELELYKLLDYK